MKKTYMEPTLSVVDIKIANPLLGGSDPDIVYNKEEAPIEAGNVGAREHHSIWDEEE